MGVLVNRLQPLTPKNPSVEQSVGRMGTLQKHPLFSTAYHELYHYSITEIMREDLL